MTKSLHTQIQSVGLPSPAGISVKYFPRTETTDNLSDEQRQVSMQQLQAPESIECYEVGAWVF